MERVKGVRVVKTRHPPQLPPSIFDSLQWLLAPSSLLFLYASLMVIWYYIRHRTVRLRARLGYLDRFVDPEARSSCALSTWRTTPLDLAAIAVSASFFAIAYLFSLRGHEDLEYFEDVVLPSILGYSFVSVAISFIGVLLLVVTKSFNFKQRLAIGLTYGVLHCSLAYFDFGGDPLMHGQFNVTLFLAVSIPLYIVLVALLLLFRLFSNPFYRSILVLSLVLLVAVAGGLRVRQELTSWGEGISGTYLEPDWPGCNIERDSIPWFLMTLPIIRGIMGDLRCHSISGNSFSSLEGSLLKVECDQVALVIENPDYVTPLKSSLGFMAIGRFSATRTFFHYESRYNYSEPVQVRGDFIEVQCGQRKNFHTHIAPRRRILDKHQDLKEKGSANQYKKVSVEEQAKPENRASPLNVIVILVDALSRPQFHRTLPQTKAFIEKINEEGDARWTEFFRFTTLGLNSPLNYGGLLAGRTWPESMGYVSDYKNSYWWHTPSFQNNNYVSAFISGMCHSIVDSDRDTLAQATKKALKLTNASQYSDHYIFSPFCHPDIHPEPYPFAMLNGGSFSSTKRCLGEKSAHRYVFEYLDKLLTAYEGIAPVSAVATLYEAHEPTGALVNAIDDDLTQLLEGWQSKGVFNASMIIIMGDHGNHMSPIIYGTREGWLERRLPLLLFSLPKWLLKKHPHYEANLRNNIQKPLTALDLYWTIRQAPTPDSLDILRGETATEPRSRLFSHSLVSNMPIDLSRYEADAAFSVYHSEVSVCRRSEDKMAPGCPDMTSVLEKWDSAIEETFNPYS